MEYQQLFKEGEELLKEAGIGEAGLDARLLLESACGTDHNTLLSHGDMEVSGDLEQTYRSYISMRQERVPVAYITGTCGFMGLDFTVNPDVLIPNQDTETLVEEALRILHDGMSILDLCTGSGCIALSLLNYSNDTTAVGTDISARALEVARANADALALSERFRACETDIFPDEGRFDIIVSNPPYIPSAVIETLEPEVRDKEPRIALDGSEDGLYFYRKIISAAGKYLYRSGYLLVEIGYDQGEAVGRMMRDNGFKNVEVIKDLGGNDRVVTGCYY